MTGGALIFQALNHIDEGLYGRVTSDECETPGLIGWTNECCLRLSYPELRSADAAKYPFSLRAISLICLMAGYVIFRQFSVRRTVLCTLAKSQQIQHVGRLIAGQAVNGFELFAGGVYKIHGYLLNQIEWATNEKYVSCRVVAHMNVFVGGVQITHVIRMKVSRRGSLKLKLPRQNRPITCAISQATTSRY